jgi:ubiquinone/menaquinone biosynthesis C-methylase UbiE
MPNPYAELMPIYPLLAQQLLDDYGIRQGRCLDIGTGHGYLGIELAKITELEMYFLDINSESLKIAEANAREAELQNPAYFLPVNVENMPFADNTADFIISRGSLWFWEDQVKGLQEIHRILKPGAVALVGGGLGRYVPETMRKRLLASINQRLTKRGEKRPDTRELHSLVEQTGILSYQLIADVPGEICRWIEIRKT